MCQFGSVFVRLEKRQDIDNKYVKCYNYNSISVLLSSFCLCFFFSNFYCLWTTEINFPCLSTRNKVSLAIHIKVKPQCYIILILCAGLFLSSLLMCINAYLFGERLEYWFFIFIFLLQCVVAIARNADAAQEIFLLLEEL